MSEGLREPVRSDLDWVPGELPPVRSDAPPPAWTIRSLLILPAMVLLWFMPKRVGPTLAASSWRAAVAAHILAITVGFSLIVWAESYAMYNPFIHRLNRDFPGMDEPSPRMSLVEYIRAPFAVLSIAAHSQSGGSSSIVKSAVALGAIELGVLVFAVALMPFVAAGERTRPLFGRCLRLTWWSTTLAIPLGIGWLVAPVVHQWFGLSLPNDWQDGDYLAVAVFCLWWLIVLLRSGHRYAGPAEGPGWESRTPICEPCGYIIAHIPRSTKCPECGRPVADSLSECRRPPAFVAATSIRDSLRTFWPTLRAAMFDKQFFRHLAIHRKQDRDKTFFFALCSLNAVVVFFGVLGTRLAVNVEWTIGGALIGAAVEAGATMIGSVIIVGFLASLAGILGRRPIHSAAIVTFWAYASLQPFMPVVLLLVATSATALMAVYSVASWIEVGPAIILASMVLLGLIVLLLKPTGSWRPFRDTRRANA